jgi:copper chaperone NosL
MDRRAAGAELRDIPTKGRAVMARILILTAALLLIGSVACSIEIDFDTPPEIAYGEEVCEECGMIISEARFAAAYVTTDGDVRKFDDPGGMIDHHLRDQEDVAVFWLHDFDSAEWIRSENAVLLAAEEIQTPMGHGVVAFGDQARVRAYAGLLEHGDEDQLRPWNETLKAFEDGLVRFTHDADGSHVIELTQH